MSTELIMPAVMREMKDKGETFFIELYTLYLRSGVTHIVAADEDVTIGGTKYLAVPFQRQNIVRSMDNITDSCTITLADCSYELLSFVLNGFDFRGSVVTIFRAAYPDVLENPGHVQWVFSGTIDEPAFSGGTFTCKIINRLEAVQCPNRSYQLACNSEFGDESCKAKLGEETAKVTADKGNVLTLSGSWADKYWQNGVVSTDGESRLITASAGNSVTLNVNFLEELQDVNVKLQKGCNKTHADCERHNNTKRYGGFPAIPFESEYR